MERARTKGGQFKKQISAEEVLETVRRTDMPFATTKSVSDVLDCSREAARLQLNSLTDQGSLERREVGASAVVWFLPDLV